MQENPYESTFARPVTVPPEMRHSEVGIISFVLSLLSGVTLFALFAVAGYIESQSPGGMNEKDPSTILLGLALIAAGAAQVLAAILGIVGLFQSNRKKIFAVLGVIFSMLAVLLFGGLMIVGLAAQANAG